ncbi:host nuclease inhibitor protein [Xanthobacter autotrophicus]|uniref:host nuclease inhibitor protein n=1 Tax=Xanthobacter TaxID=279 RepID=UPI0024AC2317|nr:host nuclease inhibitor protein [Xanthobacter autotrophicus]MDI4664690.1 host nuclease inhibitor protein [Xanthobacter autotrophicus]
MTFFAFTNRAGVIGFGHRIPADALHIADDPDQGRLHDVVEGLARHDHDGETLLVPGIPEATFEFDAVDALLEFRRRVARRLAQEARP